MLPARRLEQAYHCFDEIDGERSVVREGTATAEVRLRAERAQKLTLLLPLAREQYLWYVSSLEPLRTLAEKGQ